MKSDLLRAQRIQHGWSQAKLAQKLGVDIRTVRRWELGEAVPVPHYRKQLLRLFGKTAQELGLCSDSDENESVVETPTPIPQPLEPEVPDDVGESPPVMQTNSSYWQDEYKRPPLMDNIDGYGPPILEARYNKSRLLGLMLFLSVMIVLISLVFLPPEILIRSIWKTPAVTNTPTPTPGTNSAETEVEPQVYNRCNGSNWQSHTDSSYGQYYTVKTNGSPFCYHATWSMPNNITAAESCDFRVFSYPGDTSNVRYYFSTNHRGSVYADKSQITSGWFYFPNFLDVNFIELDIPDTQSGTIIGVGPFFINNCHPY